ncbi:GPI-anchored cell wall organization protein ecm33 [Grosmannia clavigera kw1407]|uniref:GPI-anchored cell wall organization protein ecm33 n=1 Tax=Grosmannia clavigera (strain kw1407 / UAMH 11150) TaxID=655863 RepID=F0XM66_GROCL|nr:GPI-anchored cell wall organization protein ecm33 [Grosmannia clavigera kw1407]EFX01063.1 GPI-anchored cell wall organization protein ecm33 [Grosmannia clavigera kw1407]
MFSKQVLVAVLAAAGAVSAAANCTQTTFTINSQADFDEISSCTTLTGDVTIGTSTDVSIDLSGPKAIKGDLTLLNNKLISTLKSSSLQSVSGAFHLQNLTTLSTLSFTTLTSVGSINWVSLNAIDVLTFTAGVTKAASVVISDTFLSSLDGLDVASASTIDINNNRRLIKYTSSLGNLTDLLNINANGLNLEVSFPNLIWIANMTVSNVSSFSVPSLATVNGSIRFDSNFFTSFSAPNLTSTQTGDVSFISNADLANISMPLLKSIAGGLQIANNTALQNVTGFAALKTVGGAVKLRGNFTEVELPSLADVKGAFNVESTGDITSSCAVFKKLAPSSAGGNGDIQGTYTCQSDNANANSDTSTSTASSTKSSSTAKATGSSSAATGLGINGVAVVGLAGVAALAQLL